MLREYQEKAVDEVRDCIKQGLKKPILCLPTGGGKSHILGKIIQLLGENGKKVLWIVHRRNLVFQMQNVLKEHFDIEAGIIMSGVESDTDKPVQLCTIQSYSRRLDLDIRAYNRFYINADVIMVDECHRSISKSYRSILEMYYDRIVIGCTATPARADGRGMGEVYNALVDVIGIGELTSKGYLSPVRYFVPSVIDLEGVKIQMGDYQVKSLEKKTNTKKLIGDIVENWLRVAENRKTLVFCVNVKHSIAVCEAFNAAGINAGHLDARSSDDERDEMFRAMQRGDITVLTNVALYQEGLDVPSVSCVVMARPTKSMGLYRQCLGRGLRIEEGKENCVARDTLVLTNKGLVKIQKITLDHAVWDGVCFVKHKGAICKGTQQTIKYCGLRATKDHEVMTNEGWKPFQEAAYRRLRIIETGFGGEAIRYTQDYIQKNGRQVGQAKGRGKMWKLWSRIYDHVSQYKKTPKNKSLPVLQSTYAADRSFMGLQPRSSTKGQMQKPQKQKVSRLWWERYQVQIQNYIRSNFVDIRKSWNPKEQKESNRQDRQRRTLRTRKHQMDNCCNKHEQPKTKNWAEKAIYYIQENLSKSTLCRRNPFKAYSVRNDRRPDKNSMGDSFFQTKREVWDIYGAGPLQRFTANGLLVHNCIVLDHGNVIEEHGLLDWDIEWTLDGKERAWSKPTREKTSRLVRCRACGLTFEGSNTCPDCGTKVKSFGHKIATIDAELEEIKPEKGSVIEKRQFLGMLRTWVPKQKNPNPKRILGAFRGRYGVWPGHSYKDVSPIEPDEAFLSYMKYQQIKYIKGREYATRHQAGSEAQMAGNM